MVDFLLENYSLLTHSVEWLAAITGVILYKSYKHTNVKYFIWFLIYLSICDFIGGYKYYVKDGFLSFLQGTVFERNYWWTTSFWKIGAIVFFAFYYYKVLAKEKYKLILKYSGYLFLVFSIVYIGFHWRAFFVSFFPVISIIGSVVIFFCVIFYFIELLQTEEILSFYKDINFYVTAAIFIWWLIITPIVFYDNYMSLGNDNKYMELRQVLYILSNLLMYLTFTFALIYCKPKRDIDKI